MAGDSIREAEVASLREQLAAARAALAAMPALQARLQESEARFRILADESFVGVYVIQDHKFVYVNQQGAELFAASRDEVIGAPLATFVADESLPIVEANIRRRLAGEVQSMRYEIKIQHRDGALRDCEVLGSMAVWNGRPAIVGMAIDRTEELSRQKRLEEQTRILQLILDCMGDGVAVTDAQGEFIIFNPAAMRITGFGPRGTTPAEWTAEYGIFTADRVTPFPAEQLPLARAMRGESADGVEMILRNPNTPGGAWVRVTGRPLVDADGINYGGVVVFHDTTDRRRMFEKLARAEAQYRDLVEQLPVIVYAADPETEGAVSYVSPQVEAILGFTPEEWTADPQSWRRQLHAGDRERVLAELRRCRRSGDTFVCAYRIHAKDGRVVWLHDEAVIRNTTSEGRPVVQGLMLDVSEREAERSGRMRLQALSQDLVTVQESERRRIGLELHDGIGQVLTGLRMRLAALRSVPADGVRVAVEDAAKLVDEAITGLRSLSQSLRPAVLDDLGLLPALVSHVDHWSRQTNIHVDLEHRGIEQRRFGAAAETAAYRVVQEALTNVARHASTGRARVFAFADADTLHVEIEDPGVGFDASAMTPRGAMHGIGGMRERVGLLGGDLSVESTPGRGCRLHAAIPLRAPASGVEVSS